MNTMKDELNAIKNRFKENKFEDFYPLCKMCVNDVVEDESGIKVVIFGELFTYKMLNYLNKLEDDEEVVRPYFFGFYSKISLEKFIDIVCEYIDKNDDYFNRICHGNIDDEIKLYLELKYDIRETDSLLDVLNGIINMTFKLNVVDENLGDFNSTIFYANSPFMRINKGIKIIGCENYDLDWSSFDNLIEENISKQFSQQYNFNDVVDVTIYGVGQGNLSIINTIDDQIMYDIGFTLFEEHNQAKFGNSINAIQNFNGSTVIISHLDVDHILGVIYAQDELFSKTWIVPKTQKLSNSAKALLKYLFKFDKVQFIDFSDSNCSMKLGKNITLYQGNGKCTKHCNKRNSRGLLLKFIKTDAAEKNKNALLTGDCLYQAWPNVLLNQKYDLVVVPHHGCCLDGQSFPDIFESNCIKIIPSGPNPYGHPALGHINKLGKNTSTIYSNFTF